MKRLFDGDYRAGSQPEFVEIAEGANHALDVVEINLKRIARYGSDRY